MTINHTSKRNTQIPVLICVFTFWPPVHYNFVLQFYFFLHENVYTFRAAIYIRIIVPPCCFQCPWVS